MLLKLAKVPSEWIALKLESLLPRGSDSKVLSKAPQECRESQYLVE